jgi:hypothetical protein
MASLDIKLNVDVLESDQQIANLIMLELIKKLNKKFMSKRLKKKLTKNIINLVKEGVKQQKEYDSLVHGGGNPSLRAELGVPNAERKLETLMDLWFDSVQVTPQPFKIVSNNIVGGMKIEAILSSFADILDEQAALQLTQRGEILPWLKWLLLEGDTQVIQNYEVCYGPYAASRTGMAVMAKLGGSWGVPSEFAGTIKNNFITRGIDSISKQLETRIKNIIKDFIKV